MDKNYFFSDNNATFSATCCNSHLGVEVAPVIPMMSAPMSICSWRSLTLAI